MAQLEASQKVTSQDANFTENLDQSILKVTTTKNQSLHESNEAQSKDDIDFKNHAEVQKYLACQAFKFCLETSFLIMQLHKCTYFS